MNIQYITDSKGIKNSVILPYNEWLNIIKVLKKDSNNQLLEEITVGLKQVKQIRSGKLPKKTFNQLLNEK